MKQAIVACAIIHQQIDHEIKILLTKRSQNANFLPGVYEIPGGHIEYGEELVPGLERELKEELNITVKVDHLFTAFTYLHNDTHTVELVYFATPTSDITHIKIKEDEVSECRWVNVNEIDTIVSINKKSNDPEINILKNAFKKLQS